MDTAAVFENIFLHDLSVSNHELGNDILIIQSLTLFLAVDMLVENYNAKYNRQQIVEILW